MLRTGAGQGLISTALNGLTVDRLATANGQTVECRAIKPALEKLVLSQQGLAGDGDGLAVKVHAFGQQSVCLHTKCGGRDFGLVTTPGELELAYGVAWHTRVPGAPAELKAFAHPGGQGLHFGEELVELHLLLCAAGYRRTPGPGPLG